MAYFLISHGMGGGFGGAQQDFISQYDSLDKAYDVAYQYAVEDYESYEGNHGIRSLAEICEEDCDGDEDEAEYAYAEERDGWLDFSAQEIFQKDGKWFDAENEEEVYIDSNITVWE